MKLILVVIFGLNISNTFSSESCFDVSKHMSLQEYLDETPKANIELSRECLTEAIYTYFGNSIVDHYQEPIFTLTDFTIASWSPFYIDNYQGGKRYVFEASITSTVGCPKSQNYYQIESPSVVYIYPNGQLVVTSRAFHRKSKISQFKAETNALLRETQVVFDIFRYPTNVVVETNDYFKQFYENPPVVFTETAISNTYLGFLSLRSFQPRKVSTDKVPTNGESEVNYGEIYVPKEQCLLVDSLEKLFN